MEAPAAGLPLDLTVTEGVAGQKKHLMIWKNFRIFVGPSDGRELEQKSRSTSRPDQKKVGRTKGIDAFSEASNVKSVTG
jgi:hypothetical protein